MSEVEALLGSNGNGSVFKEKFQRNMPTKDDQLIFMCRIGARSNTAAEKAMTLGYKK